MGAPASVSVTSTATLLLAANDARRTANAQPIDGTIYVGQDDDLTTANGIKVVEGALFEEPVWRGDVYAVAASGTVDTRVWEVL